MGWSIELNSHIGGREEQQDRTGKFHSQEGDTCLVVVADGMGGHQGGALAAQTVIEVASQIFHEQRTVFAPAKLLETICLEAHAAINRMGKELGLSPHSTAVLLLLTSGRAHWLHVGDCRLYHFRGERLLHRTRDHSVFQMLVDMGKAKPEEAATHPDQSRLLSSLGGDKKPEVELGEDRVRSGDGFLLCSDGLWEVVDERDMGIALHDTSLELGDAARRLVEGAVCFAGPEGDNVSVALVRVEKVREWPSSEKLLGGVAVVLVMMAMAAALWLWPFAPSETPTSTIQNAQPVPVLTTQEGTTNPLPKGNLPTESILNTAPDPPSKRSSSPEPIAPQPQPSPPTDSSVVSTPPSHANPPPNPLRPGYGENSQEGWGPHRPYSNRDPYHGPGRWYNP